MNDLHLVEPGIFGTRKDLKELSKLNGAKILVVSDSHGGREFFKEVIKHSGSKCNALLFLGDGIQDLLSILEECVNKGLQEILPPVIAFVKGNNDPSQYAINFDPKGKKNDKEKFYSILIPRRLIINIASKRIFMTHGNEEHVYYSVDNLEQEGEDLKANIALFGHTHVPYEMNRPVYLLNPGSITCPRNHSKQGFAILEIQETFTNAIFYKIDTSNGLGFEPYIPDTIYY